MIRLSLLQFRAQAIIAATVLAVYVAVLAATGPHLASLYTADGLTSCGGSCQSAASFYTGQLTQSFYMPLYLLSVGIILLAPAVVGLFWGAPLIARELETGTSALVWNQSVTRTRWLAVKLSVGALTAMTVTEALCLMQSWWAAPIGRAVADGGSAGAIAQSRFTQLVFDTHGITPLGYAAFAFALGVTAGVLIRRTIPAMAVTLAIFAALQVVVPLWVRPHLAPPDHTLTAVTSVGNALPSQTGPGGDTFTLYAKSIPGQPGAWILSSGPVNAAGQPTSTTPAACTSIGNNGSSTGANQGGSSPVGSHTGPIAVDDCLASHGIRESVTYQPASRYWPFQWTETAIYLALALALAGYCFRRLNRPIS
jgi:hypothetical protein